MSYALESFSALQGGSGSGYMMYSDGEWQSVSIGDAETGPADSPMASFYHTNQSYAGGGAAYTSTLWATTLAFTLYGRLYLNNSASLVQSTNPPNITSASGFPMAITLPSGEYLATFTRQNGIIGGTTYAEIRPYSTLTTGGDGQYHGHRTRIASNARYGGLSISRLSFSTTRRLYLRAVTFGGGSGAPVYLANQSVSLQIVRLNTTT